MKHYKKLTNGLKTTGKITIHIMSRYQVEWEWVWKNKNKMNFWNSESNSNSKPISYQKLKNWSRKKNTKRDWNMFLNWRLLQPRTLELNLDLLTWIFKMTSSISIPAKLSEKRRNRGRNYKRPLIKIINNKCRI